MDNVFTAAGALSSVAHRKVESKPSAKFSPSFGVHRGLIKDPNWPPVEFPEHGTAASRRQLRVPARFEVRVRQQQVPVTGDLSSGGAMFLFAWRVDARIIEVRVQGQVARAEVLSTSKKGGQFAHHCRFIDAAEGQRVWAAVEAN